jgi:hypothetical protein
MKRGIYLSLWVFLYLSKVMIVSKEQYKFKMENLYGSRRI